MSWTEATWSALMAVVPAIPTAGWGGHERRGPQSWKLCSSSFFPTHPQCLHTFPSCYKEKERRLNLFGSWHNSLCFCAQEVLCFHQVPFLLQACSWSSCLCLGKFTCMCFLTLPLCVCATHLPLPLWWHLCTSALLSHRMHHKLWLVLLLQNI